MGSANSGKTSELRLQARALREEHVHACFISVRELLVGGVVEDALERNESAALNAWSSTPHQQLFLFVDSIDEATLSGARDLGRCLGKLVERVAVAQENVTWVLSTRPAVLNQDVLDAIDDSLGVKVSRRAAQENKSVSILDAAESTATSKPASPKEEKIAKLFRLSPLNRKQSKILLESALGFSEASEVMAAADHHGLGHLLLSPGKCRLLAQMDLVKNPPASLEQTYRRSVALHLNAPTSGRSIGVNAAKERLEAEAARLAAASTLCERLNIELPSETEDHSPQALSARSIVQGLLDSELQYLLSGDFFEESGHQQVKMQPDDIRSYLAAKRLSELVKGREDALRVAQVLGWRAPTGEKGIVTPFFPVAGWLATLNRYFLQECLDLDPQCVAFFGDLRHMPLPDAQGALTAAVHEIVAGRRIGRGAYILTSENYWQAGGVSLLPVVCSLFKEHIENEDARELLLDIAKTVRSPILRDHAFAWVGNSYLRILEDGDLLEYFLVAGNAADRQQLRNAALRAKSMSETSLRLVLRNCAWIDLSAKDITKLVRPFFEDEERSFILGYSLTHEVAPAASVEQLLDLSKRMCDVVVELITADIEDGTHQQHEQVERIAEVVAKFLVELAERTLTSASVKSVASLVVRLKMQVLDSEVISGVEFDTLRRKLQPPSPLRTAVVSQLMKAYKSADELTLWRVFVSGQTLVFPSLDEARFAKAVLLTKVLQEHAAALERSRQEKPKKVAPARITRASTEGRADLLTRKSGISAGTDVDALSWVAQVLASTSAISTYGEVTLDKFEVAFGADLTSAVSHGLKAIWRARAPRRDEENPRSTYWSTIAGLQGLHLELAANKTPALPKKELQRALDYGLYEINGVPKWFWPLASSSTAEAVRFLRFTLNNRTRGAVSAEHSAKVLSMLGDAPAAIQQALAKDAWGAICSGHLDPHQTGRVLSLVAEKRLVTGEVFGREAHKRVFGGIEPATASAWAVAWMQLDASSFIEALAAAKSASNGTFDSLISSVATELDDGKGLNLHEVSKQSPMLVDALKVLYLELKRVLPPEKDEVRIPGKVFSVDDEERARRTRDRLPGMLVSSGTTASYLALRELHELATEEREKQYFRHLMHLSAEAMQKLPRPMTEEEFLEFERTLRGTPGSLEAFAQQIQNDILDVQDIVEKGEFSPRRFLATSVQDVEASVVKAMEDEFQLYLAGQLAVLGRKAYSVFREPQGADDARRDVSIAHPGQGWKATLELKVTGGGWTVEQYRDSLRNQLVGLYMRERHTTVGFFIVLRQTGRGWEGPNGDLDYDGLLKLLREDALKIESEQPSLRLRVIGIDATEPTNVDGTLVRAKAEPKAVREAKRAVKRARRSAPP
ncbi:hypothetical protein [Hydrogenophaga sp.]|uniref:hypothetical protein n=1 Tax=Hydrogenophaga sp. TaxID=1904254 RepID=UPI0027309D82|nr:hypothetical protein [Hydrogenophaga sp.]MDP1686103.1 hypothetical protein [Hydrogenophaga sp.]